MVDSDPFRPNHAARYRTCGDELATLILTGAQSTGTRFNLARPTSHRQEIFVRDIIVSSEGETGDIRRSGESINPRFLVVDKRAVNIEAYKQLQAAGVPQLPLVSQSDNLAFFGVPRGSKQLRYEPVHDRQSSATYVSDVEIYAEAGRIYGAAWRATGLLMLSGEQNDTPATHLALTSFTDDNGRFLYLCPPYGDSRVVYNETEAGEMFMHGLADGLVASPAASAELLTAAAHGFSPTAEAA